MSKCECEKCVHDKVCALNMECGEDIKIIECEWYKDKSLFVEFPCKVGTPVYFIVENEIYDGELVSFSLDAEHLWFKCCYKCGLNYWHMIEDFGKTVFLDRAESERKLREVGE